MVSLRRSLVFVSVLLLGLALLGCDSGGEGGEGLRGTVTVEVEGNSETTASWGATFFYRATDESCQTSGGESLPLNRTIDPASIEGCAPTDTDPSAFDGVRVRATVEKGPNDLTLRLLSDGKTLDEATDPEEQETFSGFWVVQGGDVPSLPGLD